MSAMVKTNTPGIYKRGGKYVVTYRVDGKQRWETTASLHEARKLKDARRAAINAGEFSAHSSLTFRQYAEEWIVRYRGRRRGFRDTTRANYKASLENYIYPQIGNTKLSKITTVQLNRFVDDLTRVKVGDKLLSDSTIRNTLNPVRACLATAVAEGIIRHNPAQGVFLPHRENLDAEDRADARPFSQEQLETVLGVVHPGHRDLFELLAATGLRISEALALQWKHVELDGSDPCLKVRRAYVRGEINAPKSKHGKRDVPLSPSMVDRLRQRQSTGSNQDALVFPSKTGGFLDAGNLRRRHLEPALEEADARWPGSGFHCFRHSCASMLFARGRNVKQVQEWLGHHSPTFTLETYIHLLDGDKGEGLDIRQPVNTAQTQAVKSPENDSADFSAELAALTPAA